MVVNIKNESLLQQPGIVTKSQENFRLLLMTSRPFCRNDDIMQRRFGTSVSLVGIINLQMFV